MTIPIDCEQVRISAMAASDGEEGPIPSVQVDEHLRECAECRKEVELLSNVSPLPPTIRRAKSTESIWPNLESRLRELPSVSSGPSTVTSAGAGRATNDSLPRRLALCSTAMCILVAGLIFWAVDRPVSRRPSTGVTSSNSLLVMISESAIDNVDDSAEEELTIRAPFSDETNADEIALAVVDRTFNHTGTRFVRMRLVSVYKGRLPVGSFDEGQQQAFYVETRMPPESTELFGSGNRLALYLDGNIDRGWTVTSIRDLADAEESWHANVERFCDVLLACETDDSAARYQELLATPDRLPLDAPAFYALMAHPCPHAEKAVRPLWQQAIAMHFPKRDAGLPGGDFGRAGANEDDDAAQAYLAGQQPGGQQQPGMVQKETPPSISGTLQLVDIPSALAVAQILARIHDHESAEPVLQYAMTQPPALRTDYFDLLPDLCRDADPRLIRTTRASLKSLLGEADETPVAAERPLPQRNAKEDIRDGGIRTTGESNDHDSVKAVIDQLQTLLDGRNAE